METIPVVDFLFWLGISLAILLEIIFLLAAIHVVHKHPGLSKIFIFLAILVMIFWIIAWI